MNLPMQFSGATALISVTPEQLPSVLLSISANCPHADTPHFHNYLVQMDAANPIIYGSPLLMTCIVSVINANRGP